MNLELNRLVGNDVIAGTFFIAGQHNGDTISLSKKQIKKYRKIFRLEKCKDFINYLKAKKVKPEQLIRFESRQLPTNYFSL